MIYYILSKKWLGEWEEYMKKKSGNGECVELKPEFNLDLIVDEEVEEAV